MIEVVGNYVCFVLQGQGYFYCMMMCLFEKKFDLECFLCIYCLMIVNVDCICEVFMMFLGDYVVIFVDGMWINWSCGYCCQFNEFLS